MSTFLKSSLNFRIEKFLPIVYLTLKLILYLKILCENKTSNRFNHQFLETKLRSCHRVQCEESQFALSLYVLCSILQKVDALLVGTRWGVSNFFLLRTKVMSIFLSNQLYV